MHVLQSYANSYELDKIESRQSLETWERLSSSFVLVPGTTSIGD